MRAKKERVRGGTTGSPVPRVVLYHAEGCHLCERAKSTLAELRRRHEFDYDEVDIGGDPDLEATYREWLPVIEIDGERAFVYHLDRDAFVRKLAQSSDS